MKSVEIWGNNKVSNYHGISIFLPDDAKWYTGIAFWDQTQTHKYADYYTQIDFSETQWDDFLSTLYGYGG